MPLPAVGTFAVLGLNNHTCYFSVPTHFKLPIYSCLVAYQHNADDIIILHCAFDRLTNLQLTTEKKTRRPLIGRYRISQWRTTCLRFVCGCGSRTIAFANAHTPTRFTPTLIFTGQTHVPRAYWPAFWYSSILTYRLVTPTYR